MADNEKTKHVKTYAVCKRDDCFAYREEWEGLHDVCEILLDNDFGGRPCPFFKLNVERRTQ